MKNTVIAVVITFLATSAVWYVATSPKDGAPTADWLLDTGLFLLGIVLIPLIGLALVCWGLWSDRSKGGVRCPSCWYDMRGSLPSLVCPECGHDARSERRLHKNHRYWGRIVLGVVLVLLCVYPQVIAGGWLREQPAIRRASTSGAWGGRSVRVGPAWLVRRLPDGAARLFDRVSMVFMIRGTDADMADCARLPQLQCIYVHPSPVSDAGLAHLKGLPKLQTVWLSGIGMTDAGFAHLRGLPDLRSLCLDNVRVTDAGLAQLEGLPDLQAVWLWRTQVTDAGIAEFRRAAPDVGVTRQYVYPPGYRAVQQPTY